MAARQATPTGPLILRAAVDLFAEAGYDGTSMRHIAERVGVKPASLYNHYSSKEEILWEIVETAMRDLLAQQVDLFGRVPDALARITAFVRMHAGYHAANHLVARIVNSQLRSLSAEHHAAITHMRRDYEHTLRAALADGMDTGVFHIPDVRVTSFAILDIGMGVALWYRVDGPLGIPQICDIHEQLVRRMIGAPADPGSDHPRSAGPSIPMSS